MTFDEWLSAASKDAGTYAESACQATRWLRDNGRGRGLLSPIERLNTGTPVEPG
ncbi:hypothetical protein [Nonomuraea sp. GTA35]|uniref:hypothetical protein n=1 Tax=Nonomuraea sp. GTA35 TaxID=1676746 RepID=UPI0035C1F4F7